MRRPVPIQRLTGLAGAGRSRLLIGSVAVRSVLALGFVFVGYLLLHERFAAFDVAVAQVVLGALGLETETVGPSDLVVTGGEDFNVYAIVTGTCSSAAGALGIAGVTVFLLPGRAWRRLVGGGLAVALFVAFNVVRICSILLLGWWLATAGTGLAVVSLAVPLITCAAVAASGRVGLPSRIAALLAGGLLAVLLYGVVRGFDYSAGMVSYHALAGPVLTFGTLAVSLIVLWRAIVGAEPQPAAALS